MLDQVTVIIRSVGERTESLCKKLILKQGVPEEHLFVIRETPFSKAMRVGYQKGIDNGLKWTYCIDADVLLAEHAIRDMLTIANGQPKEVFTLSGKCIDRFIPEPRAVGNHLFRTSALQQLINSIAPYEEEAIRPESHAKRKLFDAGYSELKVKKIIGLHDYEQFYLDVFRKAFVHANKHTELIGEMAAHWKKHQHDHDDYRVALAGLAAGLNYHGEVKIDANFFKNTDIDIPFDEHSPDADVDSFSIQTFRQIGEIIRENTPEPEITYYPGYQGIFRMVSGKMKSDIKTLAGRIKRVFS
jgi:hypothetical protein